MKVILDYNSEMRDDPGFLSLWPGEPIRTWFIENTKDETWYQTANRISEEGYPCKLVCMESSALGLLFKNPHHRLAYTLKMKL
jgi:hypothetical protein